MLILGFWRCFYRIRVFTRYSCYWNNAKILGSFTSFLGAAVFPIGLILVILAGGELVTGNMMTVSMAWLQKKITLFHFIRNLVIVTFSNFIGAVFVAYFSAISLA